MNLEENTILKSIRILVLEKYGEERLYLDLMIGFRKIEAPDEDWTQFTSEYLPKNCGYTKRQVVKKLVDLGGIRSKKGRELFILFSSEENEKMLSAVEWINSFKLIGKLVE